MASVYEARWRNAFRIGERIKSLLETKHLVFDADGNEIREVIFQGFNDKPGLSFRHEVDGNITLVYFTHDPDQDCGSHTAVKEFTAKFQTWRVIHPSDFRSLL